MEFTPYSAIKTFIIPSQQVVLASIFKVKRYQKKGKQKVSVVDVFNTYLDICKICDIEPIFKSNIMNALQIIEECGFIKLNKGLNSLQIDLGNYTLDEWENALYEFPYCEKFKNYVPSLGN